MRKELKKKISKITLRNLRSKNVPNDIRDLCRSIRIHRDKFHKITEIDLLEEIGYDNVVEKRSILEWIYKNIETHELGARQRLFCALNPQENIKTIDITTKEIECFIFVYNDFKCRLEKYTLNKTLYINDKKRSYTKFSHNNIDYRIWFNKAGVPHTKEIFNSVGLLAETHDVFYDKVLKKTRYLYDYKGELKAVALLNDEGEEKEYVFL